MLFSKLFAARAAGPALVFCQGATNVSDLSSYTFNSHNIGEAKNNRYVVVFVQVRLSNATSGVTCTVDGQATSAVGGTFLSGASTTWLYAFVTTAPVISNNTASIVVNFPGIAASCRISAYALYTANPSPIYYAGSSTASNPSTINSPLLPGQVGFVGANGGTTSAISSMSFSGPASLDYNSTVTEFSMIITATLTGAGNIVFTPVGSGSLARAAIIIWE